jgi:hypothetical protein
MKIAQNFSTAYGGLPEHSKPALSAFSKPSLGQLFRLHFDIFVARATHIEGILVISL